MVEQLAHELLADALARGAAEVFGESEVAEEESLRQRKAAADHLAKLRLARYEDEGRTRLVLTNPGRYWALNGGYMAFLKEEPDRAAGNGGGRARNPEMEELRFNFMMLRMRTFWWSFGLSIASFIMSSASLFIALRYGGAILAR